MTTNWLLAAAFICIAATAVLVWVRRIRERPNAAGGLSQKAFEHVAAGRLDSYEAADRLIGADDGCSACVVTLRTGRRMPLEQHDCGGER